MRNLVLGLWFIALTACVDPVHREYRPHEASTIVGSKDDVVLTIQGHVQQVHACFEGSTSGTASLNGRVVLDWRLDREGNVRDAHVRQGLDPKVDACLLAALEGWTFSPPAAGSKSLSEPLVHAFVNGQSEIK